MTDVTRILSEIEHGDPSAADQLLPLVYDELRKLAAARLKHENPWQTLQATALVHEAYVRLLGSETEKHWDSRGHFFSAAAESMRRILVDRARKKRTIRHGGDVRRVELHDVAASAETPPDQLIALDKALDQLQQKDPIKAELVKLRYFAGLTVPQAAELLGIGVSTAEKYWVYAKSWLRAEIDRGP